MKEEKEREQAVEREMLYKKERERENEIRAFREFSTKLPGQSWERGQRSRGSMGMSDFEGLDDEGYNGSKFAPLEALDHAPQPIMHRLGGGGGGGGLAGMGGNRNIQPMGGMPQVNATHKRGGLQGRLVL